MAREEEKKFRKVKVEYIIPNMGITPAPKPASPFGIQIAPVTVPIPIVPYMAEAAIATQADDDEDEDEE